MPDIVALWNEVPPMLRAFGAIALFFFLAERIWPLRPAQPMLRRGVYADALYVPIHYAMRVALSFLLADLLTDAGRHVLPGGRGLVAGLPIAAQAAIVIVALDLVFYVTHRLKHRWHWWWRLHETHHSSGALDFLASARFHPLEKLLDRVIYLLPLTAFGAADEALLVWSMVDVFFGMLNHSNLRVRLGPLIYVFVGPEMHRWHHARDPRRRDVNYGNNLSIFDWLFGTAAVPGDDPDEYGIDDQERYPQDDLLAQWWFAFRPRGPAPAPAPAPEEPEPELVAATAPRARQPDRS